jgi:ADP-dependent NAD(P)H-hydrate dehydratase / NAD(P)H-hydrate epimerase
VTAPAAVAMDGGGPRHPLVLSAAQMRAADAGATERLGIPSLLLMENAGRGVADLVLRAAPARRGPVVVVAGAGANGGDGFVVARHLARRGVPVRVLLAAPRARVAGDAAVMLSALEGLGDIVVEDGSGWADAAAWEPVLAGAAVVVDAIFGIGVRDEITGVPAAAIVAMNAAPGLKVAVDIPSGLDADTGHTHGVVFRADVTATMGARKLGQVLDADVPVGRLEVIDLGAPLSPPAASGPFVHWLDAEAIWPTMPHRGRSAHKGSAGHLLVVAGSGGKTGAGLLAGRAALRAGVGLVTVASTAAGQAALDAKVLEVMTARYCEGEDADPRQSAPIIAALAARMKAVAIGPGIPTGPHMRSVVRELVSRLPIPMVIDADALNALGADVVRVLSVAQAPRILTPHPGEMSRLVGRTTAEVQADRLGIARQLATRARTVVVLKGARTIVVGPDGTAFVNPTACGALATAGSGDVLTGVIGALLAQGMAPLEAAQAAVFVHGAAGEELATRVGDGLIAGDLPDEIALLVAKRRPSA